MMAKPTIIIGFLLVLVGVGGYCAGHPDPVSQHVSYTALIPAAIGVILALLGAISLNDGARKHAMHVAAMVGLLSIVAVAMRLPPTFTELQQSSPAAPLKLASMLVTLLLCVIFLVMCIRSFIQARRNRLAGGK
jgi:hypothetical protein